MNEPGFSPGFFVCRTANIVTKRQQRFISNAVGCDEGNFVHFPPQTKRSGKMITGADRGGGARDLESHGRVFQANARLSASRETDDDAVFSAVARFGGKS